MFYRFKSGQFVEAETFKEAKAKVLAQITAEEENPKSWHKCTCLGLSHRADCPEMKVIITF